MDKNILRKQLLLARKEFDKQDFDDKIANLLVNLSEFKKAKSVFLYSATEIEVSTLNIAKASLELSKNICYPYCNEGDNLVFYSVNSPNCLKMDRYNILAPDINCSFSQQPVLGDIVIVPSLAVDKNGYRMGFGKGYYDRFLKDVRATSVGLIYEEFLIDYIERYHTDIALDMVVTQRGVIRF